MNQLLYYQIGKEEGKQIQQEESYTNYDPNFEYKILRRYYLPFDNIKEVILEEKQNNWEVVEILDNKRIRFKRLISKRDEITNSKIDPYRTVYAKPYENFYLILQFGYQSLIVISLVGGLTSLIILFLEWLNS